jgi:hypothetical protein
MRKKEGGRRKMEDEAVNSSVFHPPSSRDARY